MKLPGPVQVEVYPDHEDFAVRTMGMPGLGALGVTFGEVVAMDSPSARKPGDFNWGATLWHEMSHVFILTATNFRVPRWFTEGLAVHEEGQALGGVERPAHARSAGCDPRQEAAARGEARSRLRLSGLSGAGDGLLFSGGQHLRLHRREMGRGQAARHGSLLCAVEDHAGGHSSRISDLAPEEFDKQYLAWIDQQVWRRGRALRHVAREAEGAGRRGEAETVRALYCSKGPRSWPCIPSMWTMPTRTN